MKQPHPLDDRLNDLFKQGFMKPIKRRKPRKRALEHSRRDLVVRIDEALGRMSPQSVHFGNLLAKRNAIAAGEDYKLVDVTEELIAAVGAMIPKANKMVPRNGVTS